MLPTKDRLKFIYSKVSQVRQGRVREDKAHTEHIPKSTFPISMRFKEQKGI